MKDRNFDSLLERFEKRVYGSLKGDLRLQLLQQDLRAFRQSKRPLNIWDAGCGFAQISLWLAQQGHQLHLCDLSAKMLDRAKNSFEQAGIKAHFHHLSAQDLAPRLPAFDLVLFHAVLEWLAAPLDTLRIVTEKVRPGGSLSLLFYNRNALVYSNVFKGGWRWKNILDDRYIGAGNKLTPPHPQYPHEIISQLENQGFSITCHTGIRVFHDYLSRPVREQGSELELLQLEQQYCRLPTFRDMGRYVHVLARRE